MLCIERLEDRSYLSVEIGLQLVSWLNADRVEAGVRSLVIVNSLEAAATSHATDMLQRNYFSSYSVATASPGLTPMGRAEQHGHIGSVGESLAWSGSTGEIDPNYELQYSYDALLDHSGHRQNLMHPAYRSIGVGVVEGTFRSDGLLFNVIMLVIDLSFDHVAVSSSKWKPAFLFAEGFKFDGKPIPWQDMDLIDGLPADMKQHAVDVVVGDYNRDGRIDEDDWTVLVDGFQTYNPFADVNGNGKMGLEDAMVLCRTRLCFRSVRN